MMKEHPGVLHGSAEEFAEPSPRGRGLFRRDDTVAETSTAGHPRFVGRQLDAYLPPVLCRAAGECAPVVIPRPTCSRERPPMPDVTTTAYADRPDPDGEVVERPVQPTYRPNGADRAFLTIARAAGLSTFVLMVLIGGFLLEGAWPTLRNEGLGFFTGFEWNADAEQFGVAAVVYYTVAIAVLALLVAVPLAIGGALFINEYAPRQLRGPLTAMVDLFAAIPSIIYGLWGRELASLHLQDVARWFDETVSFVPVFRSPDDTYDGSTFVAAVVVSLMILPIATSVMREVFSQAPPVEKEGALALGATRWGMIRTVVLPFGRGGIVGGSMLALGRALGETIAVALIIVPVFDISLSATQRGSNSVGSLIATKFGEAGPAELSALVAAGVVLFAITLVVNFGASFVVARSRSGAATEI
jgi:phosphate transport system permease protein